MSSPPARSLAAGRRSWHRVRDAVLALAPADLHSARSARPIRRADRGEPSHTSDVETVECRTCGESVRAQPDATATTERFPSPTCATEQLRG